MPYALQAFQTEDRKNFRTIVIDGDPWFVLSDVCRALDMQSKKGYYGHHAEKLDADERRLVSRSDLSGATPPPTEEGSEVVPGNSVTVISESGLYSFILRSDKPEAKRLRKWVTSVVLPSIRKTGSFSSGAPQAGVEWKPFHDRLNLALAPVPEGFFSVFREMADLTAQLITQGAVVDDATIPDISVGQAWSKEWTGRGYDTEFGLRASYEHNYPAYFRQSKSNPQWPHCYPEDALPAFRRWFRHVYLPTFYPQYLTRKVKKGDMPALVAESALKAVAASAPKPLR